MTNQELIANLDIDQKTGKISFEQWWAMKSAVEGLSKPDVRSIYDLPEPPTREEYLLEHANGLERRVVHLQDTVIRDARELEEALRLGVKMRTAQKAYFRTRATEWLNESKKLEREFDVAAAKKLDEAPKKPTLFD